MTFLMVVVLGSIFAGWATATESAGVGVLGSFIIAWLNGALTLAMVNDAIRSACRANAMVFLIFLGATGFSYVFRALGGDDVMMATLAKFGIDTSWEVLAFVMVLIFLLGFPFEWIEICLIVLPIFAPILAKYDFTDHLGQSGAFTCLVRHAGRRQPADLVHDAAVRRDAILPAGHGAAERHHDRHLSRHVPVHRDPGDRSDAVHRLPPRSCCGCRG